MANSKNKATELSYQLTDSGASVLIVHPAFLEIPASRVLLFGDKEINGYKPYRSILIGDREIEPVSYTPEETKTTTAYLPYSSGTTGKPRGVELTHTNIAANLAQLIIADCKLGPHSITTGVLGYLNNKEATDAVFDKDGFFNTEDIVSVDEQKAVLLTHDAVSDAAIIGYYSEEEASEIPVAYITIKSGHEQSTALAKEIQCFVDEKVVPHKKLGGGVFIIDKIPKSES
ncbi:9715_t:CDS:2, partial [Racocetra fulgida]